MQFGYEDFCVVETCIPPSSSSPPTPRLNHRSVADLEPMFQQGTKSAWRQRRHQLQAFLAGLCSVPWARVRKLKLDPLSVRCRGRSGRVPWRNPVRRLHQSQILETYQQKGVTVVCAFDEGNIENGLPFRRQLKAWVSIAIPTSEPAVRHGPGRHRTRRKSPS